MTVITSVIRILKGDIDVIISQSQKDATFDSYLSEILFIQSSFNKVNEPRDQGEQSNEQLSNTGENLPSQNIRKLHVDMVPEEDNNAGNQPKKQKLCKSDMPWYMDPSEISSNLNPIDPHRLLQEDNQDIQGAKFFVRIAPNSPTEIPFSQWE